MNIFLKKTGGTAVALAMSAVASMAQALPVDVWNYSITTELLGTPTNGFNVFTSGDGTQIQQPNQVSWGDPGGNVFNSPAGGRSGITIATNVAGTNEPITPKTGTVTTGSLTVLGGVGIGQYVTHHNNPISSDYATLLNGQIQSILTLTANTPPTPGSTVPSPLSIPFTFYFAETLNQDGTCVAASPLDNPCNDIFALNPAQAFNVSFQFDGLTYYASTFPLDSEDGPGTFDTLSAAECAAAGVSAGCVGFTTEEGQDTSKRFGFAITREPINNVPEPGSLALIGLGLMGFAAVSRKHKKA